MEIHAPFVPRLGEQLHVSVHVQPLTHTLVIEIGGGEQQALPRLDHRGVENDRGTVAIDRILLPSQQRCVYSVYPLERVLQSVATIVQDSGSTHEARRIETDPFYKRQQVQRQILIDQRGG